MENAYPRRIHAVFDSRTRQIGENGYHEIHKDQSLAVGVLNQAKGKKKSKDSKQREKMKQENPKYLDGGLNPSKDKEKKNKDKMNLLSQILESRECIHE